MMLGDIYTDVPVQFPEKMAGLFAPKRYKVMWGGRGGGKSWAVARALLLLALDRPMRVLCAREVQKSIKESVHQLLSAQILELGLTRDYEILETEIRGANGSKFVFSGLLQHTIDSIKSFEGCDVAWIEEAHNVSKRSWDVLIPTIRKADSEIWLTLNPAMDTDETWVRFCETPSDDTWLCEINWRDNPWFPSVLNQERIKAKFKDPEGYENIWEGKPRRVAEGAIYRYEINALYADGRLCPVPHDPTLEVHTVWDLGWNDAMTIIMCQRGPRDIRILDYIEDSNRTLDWYVGQLNRRNTYRWGVDYLPHDGRTKNFQTGKSTEQLLREMGRRQVRVLGVQSVEEGIKQARMTFPMCYFDKAKTPRLIECLRRYRRDINTRSNEPTHPLHDEFSHGADAFRYLAQAVTIMPSNSQQNDYKPPPPTDWRTA